MSSLVDEIIKGRKVFFIAPDKTLFPEQYLEEFLLLGYECYFIDTDIFLPIELKIDIILTTFKDSIIFFNIDAPLQSKSWPRLVSQVHDKYPQAMLGITYVKRQSNIERSTIERTYLYTIGINCGCTQLEYQKLHNFEVIGRMLSACQAGGRRKNVRAICTSGCKYQFISEKNGVIQGSITDISITHFSIVMPEGQLEIQDYEKVREIAFTIRGLRFRSDAILFMSRKVDEGILYVFAFTTRSGESGLDANNKQLLLPKIYEILMDNCSNLLNKLFTTATRKRMGVSELNYS